MRRLFLALALVAAPALSQSTSVPSSTPTAAASRVIRVGSGYLTGVNITTGATAGYLMLFDAAAVPADGTVSPLRCLPVAATTGLEVSYRSSPLRFTSGIIAVFSSTGCFTKTASATAFISGDIR